MVYDNFLYGENILPGMFISKPWQETNAVHYELDL